MQEDLSVLNKQAVGAAKQYMGEVAWLTVALVVLVLTGFVANLWLFAVGLLPLWAALLIYAALTYMSYTPLHEAVHGNINGSHDRLRWLNSLCGFLVAPIIAIPYASHKVEHFTHHRYTNQPDKDPDFLISGMRHGWLSMLVVGYQFLWLQNSFFVREHWATASGRERSLYCVELCVSIGWRALFLILVTRDYSWVLLLVGHFAGGLFTAYWFAYRPHFPYDNSKRYQNTSSLIMPRWMKPLEWFWLGQNLHSIHHLFPRVPFYRYHALHKKIEPIMRAHGTPIIGVFSRKPIE